MKFSPVGLCVGIAFTLTLVISAFIGICLSVVTTPILLIGVIVAKISGIRRPRLPRSGVASKERPTTKFGTVPSADFTPPSSSTTNTTTSSNSGISSPASPAGPLPFDADEYFSNCVVACCLRWHDVLFSTFLGSWLTFAAWCLEHFYGLHIRTLVELDSSSSNSNTGGPIMISSSSSTTTTTTSKRKGGNGGGVMGDHSPNNSVGGDATSTTLLRRQYLVDAIDWEQHVMPPAPAGKVSIILCNHRTALDWMVLWMFLARAHGWIIGLRIALKASLRAVPFVGWAMQCGRFLFLERDRNKDEEVISTVAKYYAVSTKGCNDGIFGWRKWLLGGPTAAGGGYCLLIFPEGTIMEPESLIKTQKWAQTHGKPIFRHVLNPRTTGLLHLRRALGDAQIAGIMDITMGYCDHTVGTITTEKCIFEGTMPREAHLLLRQYVSLDAAVKAWVPTASSPPTDAEFCTFIETLYIQKEKDLTAFYRSFPEEFPHILNPLVSDTASGEDYSASSTSPSSASGKEDAAATAVIVIPGTGTGAAPVLGSTFTATAVPVTPHTGKTSRPERVYDGAIPRGYTSIAVRCSPIIWILFMVGSVVVWYELGLTMQTWLPSVPVEVDYAWIPLCVTLWFIFMMVAYGGYDAWFLRLNLR